VADSRWLAMLARCGLLRGSFIPPEELGNLRLISRERQKTVGMLASEKNRLHKILTDGGIRLSVVVSDIHGRAARQMIECLIEGGTPLEALQFANSRLKATPEELVDALDGDLTPTHRFVLREILQHIRDLEARIARFDIQLLAELEPHRWALDLLQTIPGIDAVGAAMLIVEIGVDMETFGSAQRIASWAGVCPGNNESAGKRIHAATLLGCGLELDGGRRRYVRGRHGKYGSFEDCIDSDGGGKIDADTSGNKESPCNNGSKNRFVAELQVYNHDGPKRNIDQDNRPKEGLGGFQITRRHKGEPRGTGTPRPSLDLCIEGKSSFEQSVLGGATQRRRGHEEGAEEKENVSAGNVMVFELYESAGELADSPAHQPARQQRKSIMTDFPGKHRIEGKTGHSQCPQSGRGGICERVLLCRHDSSFL